MTKLHEHIFSITNKDNRKIVRVLGMKFSRKKNEIIQEELLNPYSEDHKQHLTTKYLSANAIIDLFSQYYLPESVVDFGCGVGAFLKTWKDKGVKSIKGLDLYAAENCELLIPAEDFEVVDLNTYQNKSSEKYGLAMSLEVAEHLKTENSERFVKILTGLSDVVLFSAAIPYQPGTEHINCQEPQFWVDLFNQEGFDCFDIIRPAAMKNKDIEWWYSQNILVFAKGDKKELLLAQGLKIDNKPMFFYHPEHVKMLIN